MFRTFRLTSRAYAPWPSVSLRAVCFISVSSLIMALNNPACASANNRLITFHIPPASVRQAMIALGRQANLQVILPDERSVDARTRGLTGQYTIRQALTRLLSHARLNYSISNGTIEIVANAPKTSTMSALVTLPSKPIKTNSHSRALQPHSSASLHEVIVTGTHISGGPPPSAPIISITQEQIRDSGYQTIEQVMDALPENFNALGSEANNSLAENDSGNVGYGAAADLMGLGYDSTLVLVNGHRLAPAGINGAFTDISVIPLGAVKRIDVMTDGASAIYGADAIGGVVNYVLRNRLHGGSTTIEYGAVTHGNLKDYRAAQSYGFNWTSGHALLSYEYHDETPLSVADRPFSASLAPGDLTPGLTQNSLYLTAGERVAADVRLHADAFYSRRRNTLNAVVGTVHTVGHAETAQSSYALGTAIRLPQSWHLHIRMSYGKNDTSETSIDGMLSGNNQLATGSLVLNGQLWKLPAGELKAAIGTQFRYEGLSDEFTGQFAAAVASVRKTRNVESLFVEGEIPILPSQRHNSKQALVSMDVAARLDHYSDFGTAFDPRLGLAWRALHGLKIRGTISSSFKAPNFYELYGGQDTALVNSTEPGLNPGTSVALLYLFGSNPKLTAEKATQWTTGLDFTPKALPGLSAHLTYYNVDFKARIADVGIPLFFALDQGPEYAAYINRNPSLTEIRAALSNVFGYENLTVYPGLGPPRSISDVAAIADNRFQNVARTRTSGLDLTGEYVGTEHGTRWSLGLNSAYIFDFRNTPVPGAPGFSVLSTLNNPVNLRARAMAGIQNGPFALHAFVNYVNHYSDLTTGTPVHVASWTTIDLTGAYRVFAGRHGWGRTRILISCVNCLDRAPPAVRLISDYLGYDPENASARGRFVSATVSVRW